MWTRQADWQCALNEVDKTELTWYLVVTITRAGALPALFPDPAFILPPHNVTCALVGDLGVDLAPAPLLAASAAASAPKVIQQSRSGIPPEGKTHPVAFS